MRFGGIIFNMKSQIKNKIGKVAFTNFLVCLTLCVLLFLFNIWILKGGDNDHPLFLKIMLTSFVIGLANFLIWLSIMITRLIETKEKNKE
jgi:uncharacterized membrane protein YhaH (DUF805 family)